MPCCRSWFPVQMVKLPAKVSVSISSCPQPAPTERSSHCGLHRIESPVRSPRVKVFPVCVKHGFHPSKDRRFNRFNYRKEVEFSRRRQPITYYPSWFTEEHSSSPEQL